MFSGAFAKDGLTYPSRSNGRRVDVAVSSSFSLGT